MFISIDNKRFLNIMQAEDIDILGDDRVWIQWVSGVTATYDGHLGTELVKVLRAMSQPSQIAVPQSILQRS